MGNRQRCRQAGFTLFEVMIALAIVAIALAAAMRAANLGAESAITLKTRTLAGWVAQNRMAEHVALADWPVIGTYAGTEHQAGIDFVWQEKVSATQTPLFRRIEIDVFQQNDSQYRLSKLVGYLLSPGR